MFLRERSGRASDSESIGPGFNPHMLHRVVSLSKTHFLPKVLVKPRKCWLRSDMTEKLLTGMLTTNKQTTLMFWNLQNIVQFLRNEPSPVTLYKLATKANQLCCNFKNLQQGSQRHYLPKGPNHQLNYC